MPKWTKTKCQNKINTLPSFFSSTFSTKSKSRHLCFRAKKLKVLSTLFSPLGHHELEKKIKKKKSKKTKHEKIKNKIEMEVDEQECT